MHFFPTLKYDPNFLYLKGTAPPCIPQTFFVRKKKGKTRRALKLKINLQFSFNSIVFETCQCGLKSQWLIAAMLGVILSIKSSNKLDGVQVIA